jgi:hypothetical protein
MHISAQNDIDLEHAWTLDQLERRQIERARSSAPPRPES